MKKICPYCIKYEYKKNKFFICKINGIKNPYPCTLKYFSLCYVYKKYVIEYKDEVIKNLIFNN